MNYTPLADQLVIKKVDFKDKTASFICGVLTILTLAILILYLWKITSQIYREDCLHTPRADHMTCITSECDQM